MPFAPLLLKLLVVSEMFEVDVAELLATPPSKPSEKLLLNVLPVTVIVTLDVPSDAL